MFYKNVMKPLMTDKPVGIKMFFLLVTLSCSITAVLTE